MIVRRKAKINPQATEIALQVSYGRPDVKAMFKAFCNDSWDMIFVAKREKSFHEADIREVFEYRWWGFAIFAEEWRKQLSGWMLCQLIKMGYITQSAADPDRYYFGDKGMEVMQPLVAEYDAIDVDD